MEQVIYGDVYFLINFSMDFLALFVCGKVMNLPMNVWRLCASAAVGSIYAVAALFWRQDSMLSALCNFAVPILLCVIAFRNNRLFSLVKTVFVFWAISFLLGGVMTALYYLINELFNSRQIYINGSVDTLYSDIPVWAIALLALICALLSLLWGRIIKAKASQKNGLIMVYDENRKTEFMALCDSGNLLCEPVGGLPVIIVNRNVMQKILPTSLKSVFFDKNLAAIGGRNARKVRIVPISTVGTRESILSAYIPDKVIVCGKEKRACIALDITGNSFGDCDGIVPLTLIN